MHTYESRQEHLFLAYDIMRGFGGIPVQQQSTRVDVTYVHEKIAVISVTVVGMNYVRVIAYLGQLELRTAVTATPGAPKHRGAP